MKCTSKEQDTCEVEKRGCEGCFYDDNEIENLIEQMTKVRPEMLNGESLKLFNIIMKVLDERDNLILNNHIKNNLMFTHKILELFSPTQNST